MKIATPDKPAITSGHTDTDKNPFHECGEWLVQRNRHGLWIGYHHGLVAAEFQHSETAALAWLKTQAKIP